MDHALMHDGTSWHCACGWRPTSANRQPASVHRHITTARKAAAK